jgi:hypothetical protein
MTARRQIGDTALPRIPRNPNPVDIRIRDDTVYLSAMVVEYQRRDEMGRDHRQLRVADVFHQASTEAFFLNESPQSVDAVGGAGKVAERQKRGYVLEFIVDIECKATHERHLIEARNRFVDDAGTLPQGLIGLRHNGIIIGDDDALLYEVFQGIRCPLMAVSHVCGYNVSLRFHAARPCPEMPAIMVTVTPNGVKRILTWKRGNVPETKGVEIKNV